MKKQLLFFVAILFLSACGVKKTQEALNRGNYVQAMNRAIDQLADNKSKKSHQPYILLLEEAFERHTDKMLTRIAFMEKEDNAADYESIFKGYTDLNNLQENIRPLLPLYIEDEGRYAEFAFRDYTDEILISKGKLSDYLYINAKTLISEASNKYDYREAYNDLLYLERINPGYEQSRQLMDKAYMNGIDYVKVQVVNATEQIVPQRLEMELLNFNTYGLDDIWTKYHNNPMSSVDYDYEMQLAFQDIMISPEQIRERQIIKEKDIVDGFDYLLDDNGEVVKDSLGNKIKVDRYRTVRCEYYEFTQFKSALVNGQVNYIDLTTNQQLNTYPLSSEFIFEHVFADYDGDKRALDENLITTLSIGEVPFPTNEDMVYQAGEDLKQRLKNIVSRHRFN